MSLRSQARHVGCVVIFLLTPHWFNAEVARSTHQAPALVTVRRSLRSIQPARQAARLAAWLYQRDLPTGLSAGSVWTRRIEQR